MKKVLLSLFFLFAILFANAQCTPDPQFTIAGIYPDSATGLTPAYVGQLYEQNITIITPNDTDVVISPGFPAVNVTIDNIDLTNVTGLPNSFSYSCDPPTCSFAGGTIACAKLFSPSPTSAEIGLHQIIFETTTYVSDVPLIVTTTQNDVIDYYYLNVSENTTSTVNTFDNTTFELESAYPNPIISKANIQFVLGNAEAIIFNVYNLLGVEMESQFIDASRGINTIILNTNSYSSGIYLYSINNGDRVLTKRMVVKN
jgi:hypothetical protein